MKQHIFEYICHFHFTSSWVRSYSLQLKRRAPSNIGPPLVKGTFMCHVIISPAPFSKGTLARGPLCCHVNGVKGWHKAIKPLLVNILYLSQLGLLIAFVFWKQPNWSLWVMHSVPMILSAKSNETLFCHRTSGSRQQLQGQQPWNILKGNWHSSRMPMLFQSPLTLYWKLAQMKQSTATTFWSR